MPKTCRRHRRRSRHLRRRLGIWDNGGGGHEGYSTILILAAVGLRVIVGQDRFRFFGSRMMTRMARSSLQKCADGLGVEYQIFVGAVAEIFQDGVIERIVETALWKQMKFCHAPKECESAAAVKEAVLLVLLDSIIGSPRPDENLIEIAKEFTGMAYKGNSQRISFAQSDLSPYSVHCQTYYERDKAFLRDLADRKTVHIDWSSVATQLSHDICTTYSDNESFRRFLSKRNRVALKVFQKHIPSPENENNQYPISNESLRVNFDFGGNGNKRTVGSNPSLKVPRHRSLELAFSESDFDDYDAIIIRSDFRAEFVSLHPELCDIIMREERRRLGFECFINKIIIEGIQKCGEEDQRQTKIPGSKSAYTGNYGASSREQPRQSVVGDVQKQRLIGSRQVEAVLKDYGCNTPYSIDRKYAPFYHQKLAAVFAQSWLDEEDRWYNDRNQLHGKKARTLRLSHNKPFDERDSLKLPYILESSVPLVAAKNDKDLHHVHRMVSAKFESQNRRISEELLLRTFGAIPFSYLGFIQMENEHKMFDEYLPGHPQWSVSRVLPKGSLGIQQQKPLHDDCNGIVSHGVWSCLLSDEGSLVDLIFTTTDFSWSIRSTTNRFCLFNGLLPHKSKLIQEHHVNSDSKKIRVHSSCYVRALHEYIGAFVFSENYRGQVLLIDEHRKYFKDETYNN